MEPNHLLRFLQSRRSIPLKEVRPDPIDPAQIELMLEAANWAPSHGQTEPWRFTVFLGEGRRVLSTAFGEAYRRMTPPEKFDPMGQQIQADRPWQAPAWISLGMVSNGKMPEWEEMSAVAIAAHNMHLMATSLGLACKWTSGAIAIHFYVVEAVGLPPSGRLLGFLYTGLPAAPPPSGSRRPVADKVRWVTA